MPKHLDVPVRHRPAVDPEFLPAVLWNRAYAAAVRASRGSLELGIALRRSDGTVFTHRTRILPPTAAHNALNRTYVERLVKFLLWQKGGSEILISGATRWRAPRRLLRGEGRARVRLGLPRPPRVRPADLGRGRQEAARRARDPAAARPPSGRLPDRLRSRRQRPEGAAVIDGKVVFSDEVAWNPYFEKDPAYHFDGVNDSLRRAAAHLPRVDAIGGSAAGVYVNNESRVGSLYRGVAEPDFDRRIRRLFLELQRGGAACPSTW